MKRIISITLLLVSFSLSTFAQNEKEYTATLQKMFAVSGAEGRVFKEL